MLAGVGEDMIDRRLSAPALAIADVAPGIWKATVSCGHTRSSAHCTVHALRNVMGKLSERHHTEVEAQAFDQAHSPREATREPQGIIADYRTAYPPRCLLSKPT